MGRSRQHFISSGIRFWARFLPLIAFLSCIIVIFIGLVSRPHHTLASELTLKPWFSRLELLLILSSLPLFAFSFYRTLGSGILIFIIFKLMIASASSFNFSLLLLISCITILTMGAHHLPWSTAPSRKTPKDLGMGFVHWTIPLVGIGTSIAAFWNCDKILAFWSKVMGLELSESTILFAIILVIFLWALAFLPKFQKLLLLIAGSATFLLTQAIHPLLTVVACTIFVAVICTFLFDPEPRSYTPPYVTASF